MIIQFENFQIKLDEILHEDFNLSDFNGIEFSVLRLISDWFNNQDAFLFKTSGSTGESKEITIHRKMIEYSAHATFDFIDKDRNLNNSLLCLDPTFIGGAMVVFRSLIMKHDLRVIKPSNNPLEALKPNEKFGLASMVPMQYLNSRTDRVNQISNVLIGGGHIDVIHNPALKTNVYATFGMTETVSHIALRKINEEFYKTTGDHLVFIQNDSSLIIKGTLTNDQPLQTNDVVALISDKEFKWIGRTDFIINSGGIKLNPEAIERKLFDQIDVPFLASSLADHQLGQKLVLIIEGDGHPRIDFSALSKYELPKEVHFLEKIPTTQSGKINRIGSKQLLETKLSQ